MSRRKPRPVRVVHARGYHGETFCGLQVVGGTRLETRVRPATCADCLPGDRYRFWKWRP